VLSDRAVRQGPRQRRDRRHVAAPGCQPAGGAAQPLSK